MRIFNTLTRQKEKFIPLQKGEVKMYSCGPTVYDFPHIGNLRAFIFADTLRRSLEFLGYKVKSVMNITDVGHLVSDEDAGEDKMEKAARREKKDPFQIARYYEDIFRENLKALQILTPWQMPRATEHIESQIQIIEKLIKNGYAYIISDGVYFDVSKFKDYGKLSGQNLEEKQAGARVCTRDEKRNPQDFALWKFLVDENKNHIMQWESPWKNAQGISRGFPGWHIECSAMSMQYLGETFDIHTGGIDHVPVHHENEIAQSEGATGKKFVNYWMHNDFLRVDGGKMSKSLGNFYKLADLEAKGFEALDYRYFCLTAHYRSKLNFTWEGLESARRARKKLKKRLTKILSEQKLEDKKSVYLKDFKTALEDDLNTAQALAVLWNMLKDENLVEGKKHYLTREFEKVLGLGLLATAQENKLELPKKVLKLVELRQKAREDKNWTEADRLRDEIQTLGYEVLDEAGGTRMEKR